jgi:DNA-binding NarL/FixJ family response regulator
MPTVLVADDHEMLRRGIRDLLQGTGWDVCAEASNGRQAVARAREHQPSVAILDVTMPEMNGLQAIQHIREAAPATHILVFTGQGSEQMAREALAAGARGYMLKSDGCGVLIAALEALARGGTFVSGVAARSGLPSATSWTSVPRQLTRREREIVQLLAEGNSNASIAAVLGVGVRTVETHRQHILQKLGLGSVVELVRYAIRNHIVQA